MVPRKKTKIIIRSRHEIQFSNQKKLQNQICLAKDCTNKKNVWKQAKEICLFSWGVAKCRLLTNARPDMWLWNWKPKTTNLDKLWVCTTKSATGRGWSSFQLRNTCLTRLSKIGENIDLGPRLDLKLSIYQKSYLD